MTLRAITELSIAVRPSRDVDDSSQALAVKLLCEDVAHLDPNDVAQAARDYRREAKFRILPMASELIERVHAIDRARRWTAEKRHEYIPAERQLDAPAKPMTDAEVAEILATPGGKALAKMGLCLNIVTQEQIDRESGTMSKAEEMI